MYLTGTSVTTCASAFEKFVAEYYNNISQGKDTSHDWFVSKNKKKHTHASKKNGNGRKLCEESQGFVLWFKNRLVKSLTP